LLYLLDANTLIDAKRDYYPLKRVPEYWDWLVHHGAAGNVKIPMEIYEEFSDTRNSSGNMDELAEWAASETTKNALFFEEEADIDAVSRVTYGGYLANPKDEEIETMGRDPFLISYALHDTVERCIVTSEGSKPGRKGANRHIPDVCKDLDIRCINGFQFIRELDFSTGWDDVT
jgi:hypothetical protein